MIITIVLKPDPVIDPVQWSGHGSDGLTRVNPKKKTPISLEKDIETA
jgi:hypothetical protein